MRGKYPVVYSVSTLMDSSRLCLHSKCWSSWLGRLFFSFFQQFFSLCPLTYAARCKPEGLNISGDRFSEPRTGAEGKHGQAGSAGGAAESLALLCSSSPSSTW